MASLNTLKLTMSITMILIFGTLFVLLSIITFILQLPIWASIVLTLLFVVFQWFVSPWIVRMTTGMRDLKPGENPWLEEQVKGLCNKAGVPMPRLAVVPHPSPNAFVFGRTRGSSTLAVHQGLLEQLDKDEVTAVLAHEVGHIKHNDCVVMTLVSAVPLIAYMIARSFLWSGANSRKDKGTAQLLIIGAASFAIYILSQLMVMWLSRSREYYADAFSAYATGSPSSLSSALAKIAYGLSIDHGPAIGAGGPRAFFIEDPASAKRDISAIMANKSQYDVDNDGVLDERELHAAMEKEAQSTWNKLNELFSTHPAMYKRILMLKRIDAEIKTTGFSGANEAYRFV